MARGQLRIRSGDAPRQARGRVTVALTGGPEGALSLRRRVAGFALALLGLPLLTVTLRGLGDMALATEVTLFLLTVVVVSLIGGMWPALVAAVGGFVLLNYFFTPPIHDWTIAEREDQVALIVFVVVAISVSAVVDLAARRRHEAAAATTLAETDRMRTALLAAVSHDLRTPLASAKAAITSLRSSEIEFDRGDRDELLATADESLDRLTRLVANLLDMSRLQAGVLGVARRPVGFEEAVPPALDELGEAARGVTIRIPDDLPAVSADPGLLERILVNLIGNALRHSPPGRPPLITAGGHGGKVELRLIDYGPGIPEDQWDNMFLPFQRMGDRDNTTGVGLGLALARGLTEAMGGTLTPELTPGGGLTMVLSLEAAE